MKITFGFFFVLFFFVFSCLCYVNYTSNITNQNDQSRMPYFQFAVDVIILHNQDDKNNAERDGGRGERERGRDPWKATIHAMQKGRKILSWVCCLHLTILDLHVLLCLYTM